MFRARVFEILNNFIIKKRKENQNFNIKKGKIGVNSLYILLGKL
jgi:hypothetical protein